MRAALLALLALAACGRPAGPETFVFHYELSVDGAVQDSTFGEQPLTAKADGMFPGLAQCLAAMKPGEEKPCVLPPEKAFGPRDPAAVETLPLKEFGAMGKDIVPGASVYGMRKGKPEKARVLKAEKGVVTLDFNPPHAGKTAVYRLRLLSRSR